MAYAQMRAIHEDALICDFAQYYHIQDIDSIDIKLAATLACGLPKESRTIRALSHEKIDQNTILAASILDSVRNIEFGFFQSHSRKRLTRPASVLSRLLGTDKEEKNKLKGFDSFEDFEKARAQFLQEA